MTIYKEHNMFRPVLTILMLFKGNLRSYYKHARARGVEISTYRPDQQKQTAEFMQKLCLRSKIGGLSLPKRQLDISLFTYLPLWRVTKNNEMTFHNLHLLLCCSAAVIAGSSYVQVQKMATLESVLECKLQLPHFPKISLLNCSCVFFALFIYQYTLNWWGLRQHSG